MKVIDRPRVGPEDSSKTLTFLSLSNSGGLSQSSNQANADTALVLAGRYLMSPLDQLTCFNAPLPLEYEDTWSLSPDLRVTYTLLLQKPNMAVLLSIMPMVSSVSRSEVNGDTWMGYFSC